MCSCGRPQVYLLQAECHIVRLWVCRITLREQDHVTKFEFPLIRVVKWYDQKLSIEKMALLRLLKELLDLEQHLSDLRRQATESRMTLQDASVVTGHELQALGRFVQQLDQQRDQLQPARAHLLARVEQQRQRVVAHHQRIKLIENLEARRKSEWFVELSKEEDALASDLFLAKLARQARDGNIEC